MALLLCGPSSWWFCSRLGEHLKTKPVFVEHKKFSDGESYVRIPVTLENEHVIIAQSLSYPQNDSVLELILMIDAAVNLKTRSITVYAPYLAYSRQDRVFRNGEPISIKALLQTISFIGASRLITIDVHKSVSLDYFRGPVENIIPVKSMCNEVLRYVENPLIIAPDRGALHRAELYANECGGEYDYLEKTRDHITGRIIIKPKELCVSNRDVVIVDDIISTGGTTANAAKLLYDSGAKNVYSVVSHAILAGNAVEKLVKIGVKRIIASNTLPPHKGVNYVDITGEVAEYLEKIL